jgi:hypothetical protein
MPYLPPVAILTALFAKLVFIPNPSLLMPRLHTINKNHALVNPTKLPIIRGRRLTTDFVPLLNSIIAPRTPATAKTPFRIANI